MAPALTLRWEQWHRAAGGHQCLSCTSQCHRVTVNPWGCWVSGIWQQWAEFLLPAYPATDNSLLTHQLWVQRYLLACRAFNTAMPSALCTLQIHTHFCTAEITCRSTDALPYLTGPLIPAPSFWVQLMLYSSKMEVSYSRRSGGRGKRKTNKQTKQKTKQNYYSPSQTPSSAADLQIAEHRQSLFCSSASPRKIKPKCKRTRNRAQQKVISVLLRLLPPAFWSRIIENSKWDLAALTQKAHKGYFSPPSPSIQLSSYKWSTAKAQLQHYHILLGHTVQWKIIFLFSSGLQTFGIIVLQINCCVTRFSLSENEPSSCL